MQKVLIASLYMVIIIIIGIVSSKKIKDADDFAVAGRKIPFWTNVYSMASAQIGAGATMGVASMCYAFGLSGMTLGIGAALGSILSGLIFARKIRESNVTTVPELIRKNLGSRVANFISALSLFSLFSVLASQVRALGTILQIFIPKLNLLTAIIIMSIIMLIYLVLGGMVAATKTDKLNISLMIISVMVVTPNLAFRTIGGTAGLVDAVEPSYLSPTTMGIPEMISMLLFFSLGGMVNNENFLRICGARNAKEARAATITSSFLIYLPYMIFCGLIGLFGVAIIPNLATSDSIIPAMIDHLTGHLIGAFLLSGLLAAVMGTAASDAMVISVTFTNEVVARIKKNMTGNQVLNCQRFCTILFTIIAVIVGYFGRSIVGIMEDVGAPTSAAIVPIFCGIFFWKKMTSKGAMITIIVALITTLGWWAIGSPFGLSHFLFGITCSTISLIIGCNLTYKQEKGVIE